MSTTDHLRASTWDTATRRLLARAIGEFAHERLIVPRADGGEWVVGDDERYRFRASRFALDHWAVDPASIRRDSAGGVGGQLDAAGFVIAFRRELGLSDEVLPVYLEEVVSTLNRAAFQLHRGGPSAAELVDAGFQEVEAAMTAGHPCFVAGSGRLGFTAEDYPAFAPEAGGGVRLVWLAARREHAMFAAAPGLDEAWLRETQLDADSRAYFASVLTDHGLSWEDVHLIPVHPWQWRNKIAVTFASELAEGRLVLLGEGHDEYQAQQSIRTFFNRTRPEADYVKTALSVLNMGFMRGLSTEYMAGTPAISEFVADIVHNDPTLKRHGVTVLRERAATGYRHPAYTAAAPKGSPYRKMLAALWRESPVPMLAEGERAATMASLLHVDAEGRPFASALIERSGLDASEWLSRYFDAYLVPIAHCLFRHGLVFMPHGENVILALRDGAVERVFLKDIGEEVALLNGMTAVPPELARVAYEVPDEHAVLCVLADVVDGFLRFLAPILDGDGAIGEDAFWRTARESLLRYQQEHPELTASFARFDLFAEEFDLSCLNRLQLRNNRQMVDLEDQEGSLIYLGKLRNPLRY
jgi:siderophore synthetase component